MKKLTYFSRHLLSAALIASVSSVAMAQGYYDDDIYYDASKKKNEQKAQKQTQQNAGQSTYVINGNAADYRAADTYEVPAVSSLNVDVDTYNRRNQTPAASTVSGDEGDFTYTQRIERFHNPDAVAESSDQELKEVYSYAMQQPQNINIYVIDADPWNFYGPSWSWRYGNPWYWNSWYSPSFSFGWGWNSWAWDPYWSWGWGPSWSWGGPGWGPGWGPSWGWGGPAWGPGWGPAQAWRPSTPSGSSRPHNYVGSGAMASHRYGSSAYPSSASRPGNMGRGRYDSATNNGSSASRPGSYTPSANTPSNNSGVDNNRPGNSGRGRSAMTNSNNNTNTNRNSYNTNNNYRQSSPSSGAFRSSGGGSRGGFSGTHGSSGGGSRGRR